MKYLYLILIGLLVFAPAAYAEVNGNANQLSMTQTNNITVKGKIVDDKGEPLPGATVQQKGAAIGTLTDFDGNFTLSVSPNAVLVVSFVGNLPKEIVVDGSTELGTIVLNSDIQELEQVVVIGYGTQFYLLQ